MTTPARLWRVVPYLPAVVCMLILSWVAVDGIEPLTPAVPAALTTFGVVVSGFVATQRNMLLGMGGARVLRFLARTGYYEDVLAYLSECVYAGIAVSLLSIAGLFMGSRETLWSLWTPPAAGGACLLTCLLLRNELVMRRVLKHFVKEHGD